MLCLTESHVSQHRKPPITLVAMVLRYAGRTAESNEKQAAIMSRPHDLPQDYAADAICPLNQLTTACKGCSRRRAFFTHR